MANIRLRDGRTVLIKTITAGSQQQDDRQIHIHASRAAAALAAAAITFGAQPSLAAFRLPPLDPGSLHVRAFNFASRTIQVKHVAPQIQRPISHFLCRSKQV